MKTITKLNKIENDWSCNVFYHLGGAPRSNVSGLVPGTAGVAHPVIGPKEGEDTRFPRSRTA